MSFGNFPQGFQDLVNYFKGNGADRKQTIDTLRSDIGQTLYDVSGSSAANDFTAQQNAIDRSFQANQAELAYQRELRADSTKYQRAAADLEAAGFNPLMAVSGLAGGQVSATAPSGSAGRGASSGGATMISALLRGISQIVSASTRAGK